MKAHCVENRWVVATADDATFKRTVSERIISGELTAERYAELSRELAPVTDRQAAIDAAVQKAVTAVVYGVFEEPANRSQTRWPAVKVVA